MAITVDQVDPAAVGIPCWSLYPTGAMLNSMHVKRKRTQGIEGFLATLSAAVAADTQSSTS
jgi:hypothetical protein